MGLPDALHWAMGTGTRTAMQIAFFLYAALALGAALAYRGLPREGHAAAGKRRAPLGPSRRRVQALAALFALDAFGGGLVAQSMLALWLFTRYGLGTAAAGTLFFCTGLLASLSFLAAVPLARRIGLVNTMVFTHLPANVCLALVPFAPGLASVVALLLVRDALSQLDVPTRSSYVMAIVTPEERPAAASLTALPRSLGAAAGPAVAGWLLALSPFGWPLAAAGTAKIAYDLLLLASFGRVRPPEEGG